MSPAEQNDPSLRPGLSDEETRTTAALLQKLPAGFLPLPVFTEVTRLTAVPIVEIVPLRLVDGKVEVLLLEREAGDPFWPGKVHTPGTVVRASDYTDGSLDKVFARLLQGELEGTKTTLPHFAFNIFHDSGRGREVSQIFWVEVLDEPKVGMFYPAENLPENLARIQLDFIPQTVSDFLSHKKPL